MIRRLVLAVAAAVLACPAAAQQPPPPKLLVVISVDGLSTALFDEYRAQSSGGFAELASGTEFRNGAPAAAGKALGDAMKVQWPASREVTVAGARQSMPSFVGAAADQRWFWTGTRFETDQPSARVPKVVPKVNAAVAAALARPRPPLEPTPFCQSKGPAAASGQLARSGGDAAAFDESPELDGDTLGLAAGLVDEMQLGHGAAPDMLAIGLSATANVAHAYGAQSEPMCLQLTELDREIGDFLALLDNRGIDYAVALTGSGQGQVPVVLWRPGFRGASVDAPLAPGDLDKTLAVLIGLPAAIEGRCLEGTPAFCS